MNFFARARMLLGSALVRTGVRVMGVELPVVETEPVDTDDYVPMSVEITPEARAKMVQPQPKRVLASTPAPLRGSLAARAQEARRSGR